MAKAKGVALDCYPGSDLVADLMNRGGAGQRIAIVGPSADDWPALAPGRGRLVSFVRPRDLEGEPAKRGSK